ncbi:MAG: peptide deformylase, partial [bacterium]|nr:peptide deformylase [bacterium]
MAAMPLRYYPAKVLRTVAAPVKVKQAAEFRQLFFGMVQTMAGANGIGLAAPQVGKQQRVIVVSTSDGPLGLINPEITDASTRRDSGEE